MEQKNTEEIGIGRKTSTFRQGRITGCSSYLKKEKKKKRNNSFQDIGCQAMKDSGP